MLILGLHFGHDAAISIVKDGQVLLCVERERLNRVKHAITLAPDDIVRCLDDLGLQVSDIDLAAITTTQAVEYTFVDREQLSIELQPHPRHVLPCTLTDNLRVSPEEIKNRMFASMFHGIKTGGLEVYGEMIPDWKKWADDPSCVLGDLQHFIYFKLWDKVRTLERISTADYGPLFADDALRYGFHYPVTLRLLRNSIPAYIVAHHVAHIAYSYYQSPFGKAAVLSTDGAGGDLGYLGGMFAYGEGNRLFPFTPNHLNIGPVYDLATMKLGFGLTGGAGKLMGLSAYGKPRFFRPEFIGNWYELQDGFRTSEDWVNHCVRQAQKMGYDSAALGNSSRVLEPVCVDFAASTQKLTEERLLAAAGALHDSLQVNGKGCDQLCMSGGVALNCPANTRLLLEGPFAEVSVPPAVMDSGLAIGSALWLYHNVMDHPFTPRNAKDPSPAYLGLRKSASDSTIVSGLEKFVGRVTFHKCDPSKSAAEDLAADRVIAWFQGRSEIGPRALGHRSILANPTIAANWRRVNVIKKREFWRPLAPAVLEEEEHKYFRLGPSPSYYMLSNSQVMTQELPAVTHVDGSARIQSVNPACGLFYQLIREFHRLTGVPVVLNTSFNGPGQPIIETPEEAIEFLLENPLDALFLGDYRVERTPTASQKQKGLTA